MQKKYIIIGVLCAVVIALGAVFFFGFSGTQTNAQSEQFVVPLSGASSALPNLYSYGFIRSKLAFHIALALRGRSAITSGGYMISKSMNVWQISGVLTGKPALVWVIIPEGLRKEQIADVLAKNLSWTNTQKAHWITVDTTTSLDYREGVYFPDTYLIPVNESPLETAKRMQAHFEEKFAQFSQAALKQNIKWTTVLKVASLIEKEAAGPQDMSLISGIIWNRLDKNMQLDIDATLQYIKGNAKDGWWPHISPADKAIISPYNTYMNHGLPPTQIDDPGVEAINAAVSQTTTTCLYYLHDSNHVIHCADTYAEHQANIVKYLK